MENFFREVWQVVSGWGPVGIFIAFIVFVALLKIAAEAAIGCIVLGGIGYFLGGKTGMYIGGILGLAVGIKEAFNEKK